MRATLQHILDLLLPPACLGCDGDIAVRDDVRLVCRLCRTRLRPVPVPFCARCAAPVIFGRADRGQQGCDECAHWPDPLRAARAACLLEPPADRIVHQLKYRGWYALAPFMAERMARLPFTGPGHEASICVAVPTTAARLRERGYNQAALLAAAFARTAGCRLLPALRRVRASGTQTTLQPAARAANVAGAFAAIPVWLHALRGAHVILIDDVLTTGATAAECARALDQAGVAGVTLITFARALEIRALTQTEWT